MENKRAKWKRNSSGSFLKYTADEFRKRLYKESKDELLLYQVNAHNKEHEFWQRDPLAIFLCNKEIAFQKLDYIHYNPVAEHWQMAKDPCEYEYSSAAFYELNRNLFSFLKDLRNEF